jgi:predicted transcriptional regulator
MELPLLEEIGRRRKVLDLSQQELAYYAGVSRSLLAKVESGHANPSYGEAKKIFETLDMLEDTIVHRLPRITLDKVHNIDIEWAEFDEPLYLKQKSMLDNKYSQLPVRRNGQSVGSLTEKGINKVLIANKGTIQKDLLVKDAMEEGFPLVPVSASVEEVIPLLQAYQGILTIKDGKVAGIVTNADILKLFLKK